MTLLALLAALGLVLGAVGIYGVISHFAARRKRDWAMRVALGLPSSRVVRHIVAQGVTLVGIGIVLGAIGTRGARTSARVVPVRCEHGGSRRVRRGERWHLLATGLRRAFVPRIVQAPWIRRSCFASSEEPMSEQFTPLGALEEQMLLAVLRTRGESYGMQVRREIERVTGRELAIGAVYSTLDRLEAKQLLSSNRVLTDGPSRRRFEVSAKGARALAETRAMRERLWHGVDLRRLGILGRA